MFWADTYLVAGVCDRLAVQFGSLSSGVTLLGQGLFFSAPHMHLPHTRVLSPEGTAPAIFLHYTWSLGLASPILGLLLPRPQAAPPWQERTAWKHSTRGSPGLPLQLAAASSSGAGSLSSWHGQSRPGPFPMPLSASR